MIVLRNLLRFSVVASTVMAGLFGDLRPAVGQLTILREPLHTLDGRAIVGANRIIARTRFTRRGSSSVPRELAKAATQDERAVGSYERFFHAHLVTFLENAPQSGIRRDDAGDARACFIQAAFKVYNGQGFEDTRTSFSGPGLWGEGAIAGMARASASLGRLEFVDRIKFLMGTNPRFAALSDSGKRRIYDFYAIGTELLISGYRSALRTGDRRELGFLRKQARRQLRADLGVDPDHVHFTGLGIEVN